MEASTPRAPVLYPPLPSQPGRTPPLVVRGGQGELGQLDGLLIGPRLLLIQAPQVPGGILLIPFEAIEHVDWERGEILLRPARESLDLAAQASKRVGGQAFD